MFSAEGKKVENKRKKNLSPEDDDDIPESVIQQILAEMSDPAHTSNVSLNKIVCICFSLLKFVKVKFLFIA